MKRIRLSVAVLLAAWSLAGPGVALADNDGTTVSKVKVSKSEHKKFRLYTQAGTPVAVALIDADGNVLYQGQVKQKDARGTSFDLTTLPDGQYYVTATGDAWWVSQKLTIRQNELAVDTKSVQEMGKPTLTAYAKNKYVVALPGSNIGPVTVTLYNRMNELVFSQSFVDAEKRRFDLSKLPEGSYTVVVGPNEKQFSERIEIVR